MCEVPVFYATTEGQTGRIAEVLAGHLRDAGLDSQAIDVTSARAAAFSWTRTRAAVLAASVHAGSHQPEAESFVRAHLAEFNDRPSVFLSVSLAICSAVPSEADAARATADRLPAQLGWKATRVVCVAGRLAYTQYGLLKRFVMRRIAAKSGGPTDTSRDHEMTDWSQVLAVAADLTERLACRCDPSARSRCRRQADRDGRAAAGRTVDVDGAVMGLHEAPARGKAQA
jgi:menaquinone-dependent protoporphyrinogen oxidase